MMIRWLRFNIYLVLALVTVVAFCSSCRSPQSERKKVLATFRIYMEAHRGEPAAGEPIPVYREHPVMIRVEKQPCMTEAHIKSARVIDIMGGFAISVQFDKEGSWILEQYTTSNKSRRFAVLSQWMTLPEMKLSKARWLAAPKLTTPITDGTFTFTPDATRDEADLIVLGLKNVAKKTEAGKDEE